MFTWSEATTLLSYVVVAVSALAADASGAATDPDMTARRHAQKASSVAFLRFDITILKHLRCQPSG